MTAAAPRLRGLLVDYGGVLTTSLGDTMLAFCTALDIDPADFGRVMKEWLTDELGVAAVDNPVYALERGEVTVPHFEEQLAARLRTRAGEPVPAEGLLQRMFAGFDREPSMVDVVRRCRRAGIRTGLLSNSWGLDYPRDDWHELFDVTVISGEVGMRKPEPRIYTHAAAELGLPPNQCVFVDDLRPNVKGAVEVGMVGIVHETARETAAELEVLLGVDLGGVSR